MDKLTIATQVLLKLIETDRTGFDAEGIAAYSFEIADAMQAEADKRKPSGLPEALKEEWQPDWSQAPDGYNWFCVGGCSGVGYFCNIEPVIYKDHYWFVGEDAKKVVDHGYQGNWKESLRERPEPKCEVDWRVAPSWAKYWAVRDGGYEALWCVNKPTVTTDCLLSHGGCSPAPSFGFTVTHIVERPNGF